ncbi:MAG TPA: helix-turn-helix domain-containing protein [Candidatus Eisenbacteria bacterium]|nr:helix-turn-helix domain-containing protein [Candidatus Eisenbacteria bacterium]
MLPRRIRARRFLKPPPICYASGIADLTLRSAVLRHISLVLEYTGGRQKWAAQELGIDSSTLWRWLKSARDGVERKPHGKIGQTRAWREENRTPDRLIVASR